MSSLLARLARNASYNMALQAWLIVLSLIVTPVMYHGLGAGQYGLFAAVSVVTAQLYLLEFGFGHATKKYVAAAAARREWEEVGRVVSTSAVVFLAAGVVGSLLIAAASGFLVESYFQVPRNLVAVARRVMLLAAVLFFIAIQSNLLGAVWQGLQRFDVFNALRGLASTVQLLGALAVVLLGGGVDDVIVWTLVVATGSVGMHVALLRRLYPHALGWPRFEVGVFRRMAGFGLLLMVASMFAQVYLSGGLLVLGSFVAVEALPLYSIPFGIFQKLGQVVAGLAGALFPMVSEMAALNDRERLWRVGAVGTRILLLGSAPLVVCGVLLAEPFLGLWMGPDFARGATPVLQLFLLAFGLVTVAIPTAELARGGQRPALFTLYTVLLATVNVGGALLLSPRLGVVGAALALVAAQASGTLFLMATSTVSRRLLAGLLRPVAVCGAYALAAAGVAAVAVGLAGRGVLALVLTGSYAWVAYRVGLEPEDRRAVRNLVPGSRAAGVPSSCGP